LGIAESIRNDNLEIFATLQKAYRYDCEVQQLGNLSLTDFCIFTGLFSQFFKIEQLAKRGWKHLYVILMTNGSVKIGIAHNIERRYSQIKASSVMEIIKHWESELIDGACELETTLHKKYKNKRLKGEYFNIDYNEAVEQAKQIAMIEG
jgi:predicted GIY-YIG superfamily endonuclease